METLGYMQNGASLTERIFDSHLRSKVMAPGVFPINYVIMGKLYVCNVLRPHTM